MDQLSTELGASATGAAPASSRATYPPSRSNLLLVFCLTRLRAVLFVVVSSSCAYLYVGFRSPCVGKNFGALHHPPLRRLSLSLPLLYQHGLTARYDPFVAGVPPCYQ